MKTSCRFAYAQARVQARFAVLPGEQDWQRVAGARTLAGFLEDARTGALRDWVKGFSGESDCHDLERGVRALYLDRVRELAGWVPEPWSGAVLWVGWLPLLPLLGQVNRGGPLPAWVRSDQYLRTLLAEDGGLDRQRMAAAGAETLLGFGGDLTAIWAAEWRRRWPRCRRERLAHLDEYAALLRGHAEAFHQARPDAAWNLRKALRVRLRLLFHLRLLQPAAPFIYLALVALDLERLRAALVGRALFAPGEAV